MTATAVVAIAVTLVAVPACGRPRPEGRMLRAEELNTQGAVALRIGNLLLAEESFLEALEAAEGVDDRAGRAAALVNLGRLELELRAFTRAAERFEDAMDLAEGIDDDELRSVATSSLARVRSMEGKHDEALALARKALSRARKIRGVNGKRRRAVIADRLVTLAWIARRAGESGCTVAGKALDEAAALYARGKSDSGRAAVAYNRALIRISLGENAEAEALLREALTLDRERDAALDVGDDLRALSRLAERRGDPHAAVDYLERSLRVHVAVSATHRALADLERLSALHRSSGNETTAAFLEGRAEEIRTEMGSRALTLAEPAPSRDCSRE